MAKKSNVSSINDHHTQLSRTRAAYSVFESVKASCTDIYGLTTIGHSSQAINDAMRFGLIAYLGSGIYCALPQSRAKLAPASLASQDCGDKNVSLTASEAETLRLWAEATNSSPEKFYQINDIFSARNNQDNSRRRAMYRLIDKGLLLTSEAPVGCVPMVMGGNPLKPISTDCANGLGTMGSAITVSETPQSQAITHEQPREQSAQQDQLNQGDCDSDRASLNFAIDLDAAIRELIASDDPALRAAGYDLRSGFDIGQEKWLFDDLENDGDDNFDQSEVA